MDPVGDQLAGWGVVLSLETRGRVTGRPATAAVGFVEEADGNVLVAAGSADADWARNLDVNPTCRVTIGATSWPAEAEPIEGAPAHRVIRELILRYGTPAEKLGAGPVFRLRRTG